MKKVIIGFFLLFISTTNKTRLQNRYCLIGELFNGFKIKYFISHPLHRVEITPSTQWSGWLIFGTFENMQLLSIPKV